jgi:class 3 adenylate cyclase
VIGLPILDEEINEIAEVGGFEGCLAYGGSCILHSSGVDAELEEAMIASMATDEPLRVIIEGMEYSIRSDPLVPTRPDEGHYIVAVPLDAVIAPFASILRALFLGGAAALALSVLLGTAISRSLTRPVRALVDASKRVAAGDYRTEVEVMSRDEMGTLAKAFNEMTRGLLVREQYRSVLSKVVSQDIAEELMKGDVELGGENREVTVLFADIRGFTALSERMGPQKVIHLLNECMEHLANAVDDEGGVVDKFIGDEVMAVFGAPVAQDDHALRALKAAARMREGVDEMNHVREQRGEDPLGLGIGIATGLAVAGNMGSSDRMNYTVLGTTVNLAARLTSEAKAGQIVVSDATREAVGDACIASSLGDRDLKGFSRRVEVFSVEEVAPSVASLGVLAAATLGLVATSLGLAAAPLSAQFPTLADAGIGYLSESGAVQLDLSGQLDLESFYFSNEEKGPSGLAVGSGYLFAPRVRLFLDTFFGDHVYGLVEWRGDRGEAPTADFWEARLEQAYLRVSNGSGSLTVQGGIFASPFGSYTNRHLSVMDPFIRPPLPYDHRTIISRRWAPRDERSFTRWKDDPDEWRADGAPPVWAVPYQWGGMGTASLGRFTFRVAAMNTPPSSEPLDWYEFDLIEESVSWVAGTSVKISPELQLGASYNNGPYVPNDIPNAPEAPAPGSTYDQELWSVDAAFARGPFVFRGEFIHDSWDVPNIDDRAVDLGYTVEAQMDVAVGWSVAARFGRIDFGEIQGPDPQEWDYDVNRWEGAVGYRITLNAGIMATYSTTTNAGDVEPRNGLAGVRLWWGF